MTLKGLVRLGFDVKSDGSIWTQAGAKVASSLAEYNKIDSRIVSSNSQRYNYFKTRNIDNSSLAYGGKLTRLSKLAKAGSLVVNAVIKASNTRYAFSSYVEQQDKKFKQLYIDSLANSNLSAPELLKLTVHFNDMTPAEFAKAHRNHEIPDINEFDSDSGELVLDSVASKSMRDYLASLK